MKDNKDKETMVESSYECKLMKAYDVEAEVYTINIRNGIIPEEFMTDIEKKYSTQNKDVLTLINYLIEIYYPKNMKIVLEIKEGIFDIGFEYGKRTHYIVCQDIEKNKRKITYVNKDFIYRPNTLYKKELEELTKNFRK